jgi:hypothetical protein
VRREKNEKKQKESRERNHFMEHHKYISPEIFTILTNQHTPRLNVLLGSLPHCSEQSPTVGMVETY